MTTIGFDYSNTTVSYKPPYTILGPDDEIPIGAEEAEFIETYKASYNHKGIHKTELVSVFKPTLEDGFKLFKLAYVQTKSNVLLDRIGCWDFVSREGWFALMAAYINGDLEVSYDHMGPISHKISPSLYEINRNHRILTLDGQEHQIEIYPDDKGKNTVYAQRPYLGFVIENFRYESLITFMQKYPNLLLLRSHGPKFSQHVTKVNWHAATTISSDCEVISQFPKTSWVYLNLFTVGWNDSSVLEDILLEWCTTFEDNRRPISYDYTDQDWSNQSYEEFFVLNVAYLEGRMMTSDYSSRPPNIDTKNLLELNRYGEIYTTVCEHYNPAVFEDGIFLERRSHMGICVDPSYKKALEAHLIKKGLVIVTGSCAVTRCSGGNVDYFTNSFACPDGYEKIYVVADWGVDIDIDAVVLDFRVTYFLDS